MCTTHPSSISSSKSNNIKEALENDNDSLSYFDNGSDQEKEDMFFKEMDSDSPENIIEKSKDELYGKVFNLYNIILSNQIFYIQFDEILGIGTFKKIYKGYDFNFGREIAWCEINIKQKDNKKNIPSFIENIEDIKKLKHPNLLEYISVWYEENKNRAVIITELLQGGNLREHRKYQKQLKIKLLKKWIKQLLNVLDYLHSNDYIHHDIKCQNILVDRISGNLKLGDLLCAEKLGNKEYFSKYIGTEEFMAPEVKHGKYTFKADIYSLGLTIIQILTMEKPYKEYHRKKSLYEAKKKGILPVSFNQIKNEEIKNFILLCLKDEKERPSCKELLKNKWLNNNESSDNNSCIEIVNNLRQQKFVYNKNSTSFSGGTDLYNNSLSPFESSNSLSNLNMIKQPSMGPIYSLEISKLNSKVEKNNKNDKFRLNSFRIQDHKINPSIKPIKSVLSFGNLMDTKSKEFRAVFSDRTHKKNIYKSKFALFKHKDSTDVLKQEEKKDNNLITIYLYIIETDYKLFLSFRENQEQNENILFSAKLIISISKWKSVKLNEDEIDIEYDYNGEKKDMEIIIENLNKFIELNKNDILLIKKKLNGKISKIIKEKKLRDLREKINKTIRNFEFLINNDEFDSLECLINSKNFIESKLPQEISKKVQIYKDKKNNIENIFSLHNLNVNEQYNDNYKLICQEYVILNIFDNDNN